MSNLTLPPLTFARLWSLLELNSAKVKRSHGALKIGYETTIRHGYDKQPEVNLYHHGNLIAVIGIGRIHLSTAGWNSSTTAQRLHKVLTDNEIGSEFGIGVRQGVISVLNAKRKPIMAVGSVGVDFNAQPDGTWTVETA